MDVKRLPNESPEDPYNTMHHNIVGSRMNRSDVIWLTETIASSAGTLYRCGNCGAAVPGKNTRQHEDFHQTFSNRKDDSMSTVLWCDPGNHAFKKGAPGSLHFEGELVNEETGMTENQSMDACVDHNPMRINTSHIVKELQAEYPVNGGVTD